MHVEVLRRVKRCAGSRRQRRRGTARLVGCRVGGESDEVKAERVGQSRLKLVNLCIQFEKEACFRFRVEGACGDSISQRQRLSIGRRQARATAKPI